VILGGGTARPSLRGRLLAKASASQSLIASILAALALILRAFRARTLSIVRKLWTTFAEAKSLALLTMVSRLRCRASETASARWSSPERDVYGELPEDGRRIHFGHRAVRCSRTVEAALPDGSTRQLRGTNVIVSTGSRATLEAIHGLAQAQPLTHIEALELGQVPEHLLVIGGGYIGVELSQAMRDSAAK